MLTADLQEGYFGFGSPSLKGKALCESSRAAGEQRAVAEAHSCPAEVGREKHPERPLLSPLREVTSVASQQAGNVSRQRLRCVLVWSRKPDTTKESQLEFCLRVAGTGARGSEAALLLKTTTDTALHRCSFTKD